MKIGKSRIKALPLAMLMAVAMILSVMPAMQVRAEASKEVPVVYGHYDENHNWCIDGEKLDDDSLKYEIKIDRNIKMMIPKKNIDKLFIKK